MKKTDQLIPWLTYTTMSFDTGDYNNDQLTDFYAAQIARPAQSTSSQTKLELRREICRQQTSDPNDVEACFRKERERVTAANKPVGRVQRCDHIEHPPYRTSCAILGVIAAAVKDRDPSLCSHMPASWPQAGQICALTMSERVADASELMEDQAYLGGHETRNVLLQKGRDQIYQDATVANNVESPGWSWNAKFVDLDQDGWQDIYVATAEHFGSKYGPNAFYRNQAGVTFKDEAKETGLSDLIPSTAYVLTDYDRDGDIDVIRAPGMAQPIVHRSDAAVGQSFWISLRDEIGNSFGIGASIQIETTSADTPRQSRELKASGGFISFDAPKVHFGLGQVKSVKSVKVTWRDGGITTLQGPFRANSEMTIRRAKGTD